MKAKIISVIYSYISGTKFLDRRKNMKIIVTTDSTSDISKELLKKRNIYVSPLLVNLGDDEYIDGENITNEDLFSFVDKTGILPKTAARSSEFYREFFLDVLKKNKATNIVHISLSSELSSSYSNAKLAAEEIDEGKVEVIDSLSLSSGSGLLCLSAADKIDEGKTFEEVVSQTREEVKKVQASFIINNLNYLYKGGRCSAIAAFGANVLSIKPKIKLADGKMGVDKKYMGKFENVLNKYVDDLLKDFPNPSLTRVYITFTTNNDEINKNLAEKLKNRGFKEIILNFAGSTIASHCGRNCLGVLFLCENEI